MKPVIKSINNSALCYQEDAPIHIRGYYNYCASIIAKKLESTEVPVNVNFGRMNGSFDNDNETINIDIQVEHTLVKQGGRGVTNIVHGETLTEEGDQYLVRLDDFNYFNTLDCIIEYSIPNINHIKTSGQFNDYANKLAYIAPLLYDLKFPSQNRQDIITLFTDNPSERRTLFVNKMLENHINHININNCYSKELMDQYDKTKILINVHQTDHHHTFEELRVLPALLRGVLVISEDVPRKDDVPYSEYIIWSSYDNLAITIKEVRDNYKSHYNRIFNKDLKTLLKNMEEINNKNLEIVL
tara:strand:- start:12336 stop:13232 length:897 start_codon:yes stop_codon:yes gene_type:complete